MSFVRKFKKGGQTYLAEVENKRVGGKVVQRFIRYVGREADGRTVLSASMSDAEVEGVKSYGPLLVLHHIAGKIRLAEHLGPCAGEILSMVYAHCLDYRSVNNMPNWFARTDLNLLLGLKEVTEGKLLSAMEFLEKTDAEQLQQKIHDEVRTNYKLTNSGVIYDVTNTYFYGKHCPLARFGHDKDGVKGRPLVQIGLGCTKDEGVAVFHKVFHGNIHDSKTLHDLLSSSFGRYGIRKGLLVYDRGTVSGQNIKDIKQLQWDTLCGIPLHEGLKKFWRPFMKTGKIVTFQNRVHFNNSTFFVITRPYKVEGVNGTLALCLNEQQRQNLRESRYQDLAEAQQLLRKKEKIRPAMKQFFDRNHTIKQHLVEAAEEFDGYSCLFCTCPLSKQEMVEEYFDKDLVEKVFRTLKGIIHLRPIRHWLHRRVIGHIFICFLAYLLLSLLRLHLKPIRISPEEALRELETMYKVYLRDPSGNFRISKVVTLTKKQKTILMAVDKKLLKV